MFAVALVAAGLAANVRAADADTAASKLNLIHVLVQAGKSAEAAAAMRSLYPKGPPAGGEQAREYYDVIGDTPEGRDEAQKGLEDLVKSAPGNLGFQITLAKQLTRRPETRARGLSMFQMLAANPKVDKKWVMGEWRAAVSRLPYVPDNIPAFQAYLGADPNNTLIQNALAVAKRAQSGTLPWELRDQAAAQVAAGQPEAAIATLRRALKMAPTNAWVRFDLARLYHSTGDVKGGRALMEDGLKIAPRKADMIYANALYVGLLDETTNALRLIDRIPRKERSSAILHFRKEMEIKRQTQHAQRYFNEGDTARMTATMQHAERAAGDDPDLAYVVASGWMDMNQPARGVALMRTFGEQPNASLDTLIQYAKILNRAGQNDDLARVLLRIGAFGTYTDVQKVDVQYLRASLASHRADDLRRSGKIERARAVLKPVLAEYPEDTDMLMAMARVHEDAGEPDNARAIYLGILQRDPQNADAKRALEKLAEKARELATLQKARRAQGYASTGLDYLSKGGYAPGIGNLRVIELPVEARLSVGTSGGRVFAQVAPAMADAGPLQSASLADQRQYGTVAALSQNGLANAPGQSARGTALAVGYEDQNLRADIGSTPIGFPVSNVTGGVKWSHYTAVSGFTMEVSRRPIVSSLIAYAGARDPVTGMVWGGVVRTGANMHLGHDYGRLNLYLEPGYYRVTGQNVLSNTDAELRTGFNWAFINESDMRLKGGVALTYWHYAEDMRYYTFGQGGYYSPQRYAAIAPNFRWSGREDRWSYLVQGSVSYADVYEKDMPYYPTDPNLQALAAANAANPANNMAPPVYVGGSSHIRGHSLGVVLEYRVTPKLIAGALGQIDRSTYYSPNYAVFYLRYMFDAQSGAMHYPPEPLKAYSHY